MPRLELRPFSGLSDLEATFSDSIVYFHREREDKNRRIEMSAAQLLEPGAIRIKVDKNLIERVEETGYQASSVCIQVSSRGRSRRLRSTLGRIQELHAVDGKHIDFNLPADPNGQEVAVELVLQRDVSELRPGMATRRHTWLARCDFNLVSQREPTSFPRMQLTDKVRKRLKLPARSVYFVEISDSLLGDAFETSITIWIDKDLGSLLDQKETSSAGQLLATTIAIDTAISIGTAAWLEARSENGDADALALNPALPCTQWLASKWSAISRVGRARTDSQLTSYARQFAQDCAESPEVVRGKLQHIWGVLRSSQKTLQEAQG